MKKLILLHGALGAASQFANLKKLLADKFEIHTLNFEGHGDQPTEKEFAIDLFAENLKTYLDRQALRDVYVFGYSMGGYVALRLAQTHPSYFAKIITLGTKFHWTPTSAAKEVKMLDAEKIQEKVPAFADALSKLHHGTNWKIVLQKTARMMIELGDGNALTDNDFKSIKTNCLIGVGDQDAMVTIEETRHIASLIPNAAFYLLENTVHPIDKLNFEKISALLEEKIDR